MHIDRQKYVLKRNIARSNLKKKKSIQWKLWKHRKIFAKFQRISLV